MEPQNHPFAKKTHLPNLHSCVRCQFSRVYEIIQDTLVKFGLTKQIHQKNPSAKINVHEKIQVLFGDNPPPFVPKNLTANQGRPSEMGVSKNHGMPKTDGENNGKPY